MLGGKVRERATDEGKGSGTSREKGRNGTPQESRIKGKSKRKHPMTKGGGEAIRAN